MVNIPGDLIAAVADRRVIPFVGAGFSASVGLPNWETLLSTLAAETQGSLSYADLKEYTGGDNLQMAEYLYLKSDRRIGPLRHVIEQQMPSLNDPALSAPHVELVNLGAPQIYTTNYDDLIESTYRALRLPVNVVALGRDVAVGSKDATQVVKYHGDLRHEETLVLTESSYFKRLDFESAMDVKFRADLLGRSVLFMGYSFRDINIRYIWFKLNKMMEDIPAADRKQSYIVSLEANPVMEVLNESVGLKTIVLDPLTTRGTGISGAVTSVGRGGHWVRRLARGSSELTNLGDFLSYLATVAAAKNEGGGGGESELFVSSSLLELAERECDDLVSSESEPRILNFAFGTPAIESVFVRKTPKAFEGKVESIRTKALGTRLASWGLSNLLIQSAQNSEAASPDLTWHVVRILLAHPATASVKRIRERLIHSERIDWTIVWGSTLGLDEADVILDRLRSEMELGPTHGDEDIAYAAWLTVRALNGLIEGLDAGRSTSGRKLLERAAEIYPAIGGLKAENGPPHVDDVLSQIRDGHENNGGETGSAQGAGEG